MHGNSNINLIVHWLVFVQNKKKKPKYIFFSFHFSRQLVGFFYRWFQKDIALFTFCFGTFIVANILDESESNWFKFLGANATKVRGNAVSFPQEDRSAATKTLQNNWLHGKTSEYVKHRIDTLSWRQLYL